MSESAICVAVRVRPLDKDEDPLPVGMMMSYQDTSINMQNKLYTFDCVFPPGVPNKSVYDTAVAERISHIFEGCNVTILAYGSTGSGKTYTMGTNYDASKGDSDIGIIPRCIKELFRVMESRQNSMSFSVKISFLELYREEIYDLLQKPPVQCALREDLDGVKVSNLSEVPVNSVEDAFIALRKGCIARRTCATAKNLNSSRSHGLFSVYIEQTDKATLSFKRCKFQLVDLAGSERVGSSKTTGIQVKEGININLGLLTLRTVISKLAEDKKQHVPYRNSKLTRLLQDSLGGNSHTLMIACVSSSNLALEETLSTLRYASCARNIKNQPQVNIDPPTVQIEKLKKQVQELQLALCRGEKIPSDQNIVANIEGSERYEELQQELQNAYDRIKYLRQQSVKIQEKNNKAVDSFKSLNEKIKFLIAELTAEFAAVVTDKNQFLHQTLKNLEEIHQEFQLLVDQEPNKCFDVVPQVLENREILNSEDKSSLDSDLGPHLSMEDINDEDTSDKLCEISECITLKTGLVKSLEDYFQTVENVDQDYVSSLVEKINKLVKEKEELEESKKTVAERMEKCHQEKIAKYESEIKDLQKEVRAKKIVLQTKEENQRKITLLQKEIQELKRLKVDLVKQLKEGGTKFVRLQREKNREVAQLVKDSRKKEFAFSKLVSKLESQLSVLKKRLDIKTLEKKSVAKAIEQKKMKSSQQTNLESIEKRIDQVLDVILEMKITEVHNRDTEEELNTLIPDFQKYQADAGRNLSKEEEDCIKEKIESARSYILSCIEKTKEERKQTQQYNENEIIQNFMNSLGTFRETKVGIQYLFKQYLSMVEKNEKEKIVKCIEIYKEHQEETNCHLDKIKLLHEQNAELQNEISCVKKEYEIKVLQEKQEAENLKKGLLEEVHSLVQKQQSVNQEHGDLSHDVELQNKIKLQGEMIELLSSMCEDYKKKTREIQALSQQVFNAKKGKRVTWLGDITNRSAPSEVTAMESDDSKCSLLDEFLKDSCDESYPDVPATPVNKQKQKASRKDSKCSLLDEFLNDSFDESFTNDMADPDWRATPVYRQRQKASRKISPDASDDIQCPPAKKSPVNCHCVGECKTMRCKCKKNKMDCTIACFCDKDHCMNTQ